MSEEENKADFHQQFLDTSVGMVGATRMYDRLARQYNQTLTKYQYKAPQRTVEALVSVVGDRSRAEMKVMDLGCGTGLAGELLHAAGFTHLDGLDASQRSLDVARSLGVYRELICAYVARGEEQVPLPDDSYDALTISGSMGINVIPAEGIQEMHRLVKPGGYIVNVMRLETLEEADGFKDRLEPMMQQMEADGKWRLVSRVVFPNFVLNDAGVIFTHQVC